MSNFSKKVIQQAGYKCRMCGSIERSELTAHHLYSQAKYSELKGKCVNGMCLCKACHQAFNNAHPHQPATPQMFIEWAKKQNLPKKKMEPIQNLCKRAIEQFAHKVESQCAQVTPVETVSSVFNGFDQITHITLPRYLSRQLETVSKSRNMSPAELAIHLLEYELECAVTAKA